jgi:hypothetical protein
MTWGGKTNLYPCLWYIQPGMDRSKNGNERIFRANKKINQHQSEHQIEVSQKYDQSKVHTLKPASEHRVESKIYMKNTYTDMIHM